MNIKKGIGASPGVAIGPALLLDAEEYRIPRRSVDDVGIPNEIRRLDSAIEASKQELEDLRRGTARKHGAAMADIFAVHHAILADPALRRNVVAMIESQRATAAYAFTQEMKGRQKIFLDAPDPYFRQRVHDLYDIERRVLRHILGREREDISKLTEPVVLVAHDITPSQAVTLDRSHILGLAINVGGSTSHTAIIARMLDIPAVVALGNLTTAVSGGETVIVDGSNGVVIVAPDALALTRYHAQRDRQRAQARELVGLRDLPAVTRDGVTVNLYANIELAEEARSAIECGAEGIGLYRSEFLFLSAGRVPNEEQQFQAFRAAVRHVRGKPLTIRTIDLGADKLSEHIGPEGEHNPVLGMRSLRYCLQHLDMFRTHLRAILRASAEGDVRIMFPMITTLMEMRQARATLQDVMEDMEDERVPFRRDIPVGIMVETPSAALMASAFARECHFFSLGTNDLTQYCLAVDRGNERVAYLYAPHSPAVLRLIREVVRAAGDAKIGVSVCGEMGGERLYTELLLGLGLRSLSMAPQNIAEVKRVVRSSTLRRCEEIARDVMRFEEDRQVFSYLRDHVLGADEEVL
jgi:phosphoenolpyruvate-protein phosphotransferase (PTS system enzyme I)